MQNPVYILVLLLFLVIVISEEDKIHCQVFLFHKEHFKRCITVNSSLWIIFNSISNIFNVLPQILFIGYDITEAHLLSSHKSLKISFSFVFFWKVAGVRSSQGECTLDFYSDQLWLLLNFFTWSSPFSAFSFPPESFGVHDLVSFLVNPQPHEMNSFFSDQTELEDADQVLVGHGLRVPQVKDVGSDWSPTSGTCPQKTCGLFTASSAPGLQL